MIMSSWTHFNEINIAELQPALEMCKINKENETSPEIHQLI